MTTETPTPPPLPNPEPPSDDKDSLGCLLLQAVAVFVVIKAVGSLIAALG